MLLNNENVYCSYKYPRYLTLKQRMKGGGLHGLTEVDHNYCSSALGIFRQQLTPAELELSRVSSLFFAHCFAKQNCCSV